MNRTTINTGLYAAIICLASFIIWIISFVGIALTSPLFFWSGLQDYVDYATTTPQFFQYLAKSFMILFSLAYLALIMVFREYTNDDRKLLGNLSLAFALMFALASAIFYFVQVSAVRFAIAESSYAGLEHFVQANPTSVLSSVNMLGWTLFLGLSSLFIYLALRPDKLTKAIRLGLLINTVSCLSAGIGYLFQIDLITFISINLGVGVAFILVTISSVSYFSRLVNKNP